MCADGSQGGKISRPFKYARDIQHLSACPPRKYKQDTREAYRWVKELNGSIDPKSFLPPGKVDAPRRNHPAAPSCQDLALSAFVTAEAARKRYRELAHIPGFVARVGDKIAVGVFGVADGVQSKPCSKQGHFELHEYADVNLAPSFNIIGPV